MKTRHLLLPLALSGALFSPLHAQVVHTSPFITTGPSTDFETLPSFAPFNTPYSDGGVTVQYVGTSLYNFLSPLGLAGTTDWYPNGGGNGYTSVKLTSGGVFDAIQFLAGSGFGTPPTLFYQMLLGGTVVATGDVGQVPVFMGGAVTRGLSGVVMDEIRLQGTFGSAFDATGYDALALDDVRLETVTATPEPATLGLMALGLGMVGMVRRRSRARTIATAGATDLG